MMTKFRSNQKFHCGDQFSFKCSIIVSCMVPTHSWREELILEITSMLFINFLLRAFSCSSTIGPRQRKIEGKRGRIPSQEESPLVRVSRELSWPARRRLQRWMSALSLLLSSLPRQPPHSSYCRQQWRRPHYSSRSALLKESLDFSSHLLNYFWNFHLSSSHYAVPSPHSRRRGGVFDLSDGAVLVHIRKDISRFIIAEPPRHTNADQMEQVWLHLHSFLLLWPFPPYFP